MRFRAVALIIAVAGISVQRSVVAADEPPLSLTISGPHTAHVGEQIFVRRVLTNLSSHHIQIFIGTQPTIIVHDENGKIVPQTAGGWGGSFGFVGIDPEKSSEDTRVELSKECDFSKPGKYTVQFERPLDYEDPKSVLIKSNLYTITITPAAK